MIPQPNLNLLPAPTSKTLETILTISQQAKNPLILMISTKKVEIKRDAYEVNGNRTFISLFKYSAQRDRSLMALLKKSFVGIIIMPKPKISKSHTIFITILALDNSQSRKRETKRLVPYIKIMSQQLVIYRHIIIWKKDTSAYYYNQGRTLFS